ncbi:MAG: hypothetical protein WD095_01875 [Candidatus Paceibacterota bacterium]
MMMKYMMVLIPFLLLGCGKASLLDANHEEEKTSDPVSITVSVTETVEVGEEAIIKWRSENAKWVEVTYTENPTLNGEKRIFFNTPGEKRVVGTAYDNQGNSATDSATIKVVEKEDSDDPPDDEDDEDEEGIYISVNLVVDVVDDVIHEAAKVNIERGGNYRVITTVEYDGNEEKNESYFLQTKDPSDKIRTPRNPNLVDLYKIVEDNGKSNLHREDRYSGIFLMPSGVNYIELHHYSEIHEHHRDFMNGEFVGLEDVKVFAFRLEFVGEE